MRLSSFDYTVLHKKGSTHTDADSLSRMIQDAEESVEPNEDAIWSSFRVTMRLSTATDSTDRNDLTLIREKQLSDPFCISIRQRLDEEQNGRTKKKFVIFRDTLFRKQQELGADCPLLVIPRALVDDVIAGSHAHMSAGHSGIKATIVRIRGRYWWPTLKRDVVLALNKCEFCLRKKRTKFGLPEMMPMIENVPEIADGPFAVIGMDLIDLHGHSACGYKYIITCIDYATRYLVTEPIKKPTAAAIRKFIFERIVSEHSVPKIIISDNGTCFAAEIIGKVVSDLNIRHKKSAVYHPQTNGLVERTNQTIKNKMAPYVNQRANIWQILKRSTLTKGHSFEQVWEKQNKYRLIDNWKSFWNSIETLPLTPTKRVNFCKKSEKSG